MKYHYTVIGKRWFDRINGNTYHSVQVFKNGEHIGGESFDYGYGNHFEQCALEIIKKDNKRIGKTDSVSALWHIKELGHSLVGTVIDVQRKKDL